jgi:hypothetical protein
MHFQYQQVDGGLQFRFFCGCGLEMPWRFTAEAAGRDADLHMAERSPNPKERRPCSMVVMD